MKKLLFILFFLPSLSFAVDSRLGSTPSPTKVRLSTDIVNVFFTPSSLSVSSGIVNVNSTIDPITTMNPLSSENNEANLSSFRWVTSITSNTTQATPVFSKFTNTASNVNPLADGVGGVFVAKDTSHANNGVLEGIKSWVIGQGIAPEYAAGYFIAKWVDDGTGRGTTSTIVGLQANVSVQDALGNYISTGTKIGILIPDKHGGGASGKSWSIYSLDSDPSYLLGALETSSTIYTDVISPFATDGILILSKRDGDMTTDMNVHMAKTSGADGSYFRLNATGAQSQPFQIINAWDATSTYDYWKIGEFGTGISLEVGNQDDPLAYVASGYSSFLSSGNSVINRPLRSVLAVGRSTSNVNQDFFDVDNITGDYNVTSTPFRVAYDSGTFIGKYLNVSGGSVTITGSNIIDPAIYLKNFSGASVSTMTNTNLTIHNVNTDNISPSDSSANNLSISGTQQLQFNDDNSHVVNFYSPNLIGRQFSGSANFFPPSSFVDGQILTVETTWFGSIGNMKFSSTVSTLTVRSTVTTNGFVVNLATGNTLNFSSGTVTSFTATSATMTQVAISSGVATHFTATSSSFSTVNAATVTAFNGLFTSESSTGPIVLRNDSASRAGTSVTLGPPLIQFNSTNAGASDVPQYAITDVSANVGFIQYDTNYLIAATANGDAEGFTALGLGIPLVVEDCFRKGTKVWAEKGYRNIEEIKSGEKVWSMETMSHRVFLNTVEKAMTHTNRKITYVINEKLYTNQYHKIFANGQWTPVPQLKLGQWMIDPDGNKVWVYSIEQVNFPETTYNLHMKNQNLANYFVLIGDNPKTDHTVLVHNKCPYLYSIDQNGKWHYETTFLYGLDSKEKRTTQRRELKTLTNQFTIFEIEPEESYIESLYLIAATPKGEKRLSQINPRSYKTKQGDIINIEFEPLPKDTKKLFIEATGYYEETK